MRNIRILPLAVGGLVLFSTPNLSYAATDTVHMVLRSVDPTLAEDIPSDAEFPEVSYSELVRMMNASEIGFAEISKIGGNLNGERKDGTKFSVVLPQPNNIADRLAESGVETKFTSLTQIEYRPNPKQVLLWSLLEIIPWLILGAFFLLLFFLVRLLNRKSERRAERVIQLLEKSSAQLDGLLQKLDGK